MGARVAVIGGGVSGAAFALHLLRDHGGLPVQIEIIEPRLRLGAGLAYDNHDAQHRINVAAARMAVFSEDPTHFERWFRDAGGPADDPLAIVEGVGLFPRRAAFGLYMDTVVREAAREAPHTRLRHTRARATAVRPGNSGYRIELNDGGVTSADVLVLATGHPAAEPPPGLRGLAGDPGLIADPWSPPDVPPAARVLIIGTGLTMADVVATLRAGGHVGEIMAVSRRGLLPRPRTRQPVQPRGAFAVPPSRSARDLVRQVRAEVAAGHAAGQPWEDVIDALRAQGRDIWAALPLPERQRLLRHVQPFWDAHRYQCAPQIEALLHREIAGGGLRILAASLRAAVRRKDGGIAVTVHPRGMPADTLRELVCDVVITCTGPAHRHAIAGNAALRSLADAGLIAPDPTGLGIAVDQSGRASGRIFVAGPLARGAWGELMGLPQVSNQPREIAGHVASLLGQSTTNSAQEIHA